MLDLFRVKYTVRGTILHPDATFEMDDEEEWCVFKFAKAITHPAYKDRLLYGSGGVDVWVGFFHEGINQLTHAQNELTMFKYVLGALKDGKASVQVLV